MRKLKLFFDAKAANTPPRGISKASRVIFSVLTLLLLSIGQMWAADVTSTMDLDEQSTTPTTSTTSYTATESATWTLSYTAQTSSVSSDSGDKYYQIGSGKKSATSMTWTSSSFSSKKVKQVKVKGSTSGSSASVSVVSGSTTFTATTSTYTSATATTLTFNSPTEGGDVLSNDLVITLSFASAQNKNIRLFQIDVIYDEGGDPDPVLESIVISGTPEKDTYEAGEEFDPTGLVATGHYDNSTSADITSSVEWAYTPAGALTQGLTSVNVTATKGTVEGNKDVDITVNAALPKSTLIFTAACNGSGTADDDAVWTVTSDGTESTVDPTKGIHYGTGSVAVQYIRLTTSDIEGTITKVVVNASTASGVSATASVTIGGDAFGGDAQSLSTSAAEYTFTGSASGEIVVLVTKPSSATKAIYVKSIVVYYIPAPHKTPAGLAYDDSDLSNLVKLGSAFTAPTLANPHSLSVAYTSSNTNVAEVAGDGTLTIKAVGVAEITASSAETETYKAGSAKYTIYVVAHDGTEADPYTVADARVIIDKVGETGIADKYAKGIVSEIVTAYNSQYGNISYNISDDGTTTAAQLQAFRGKGINGENFTSEDDVMVGDEVVVKGLLKKFNTTYEFDAGNQLVSLNRNKEAAGLEYAETAIEKNIGDAAFTNALTNPNNLEVSYSSSATGVATVDENGEVTIVGMGTTTIKATFAGNGSYLADEVSYTLTVNDPSLVKVTFDATVDIASDNAEGITKNGVNIKASHVDGVNGSNNEVTYYQCFKNATFTATCTSGNIKRIEFSCTSSNPASGFGESYADGVWTGDAAIVEITATVKQVQMNTVTVYYKVDARAEAGLAYAETAIEKHVGDEAFVNALTNPNNLTVAYESSNTDVAEVAADGSVTIKAEGTTTITASFDGDADYKPASVSYELTVNEAGLDNVTFNSSIDLAASGETTISKGGFTLTFSAGSMDGTYSEYRLHKSQTMTLSSTDYKIKKIEFTCTAGNPIDGFEDATGLDKEHNQWTGDANKVELTASNAQVRMTQLVVYYVEDTRAASDLAWSTDEVEITLGDPFTAASLVNPNSIDAAEITIESSNTNLAIVENGVVSLVEDVTGTATITATFAGNATYKPAEFSYTITVNDPTPMIITNPTTYLNFGSVEQGATINAKNLQVTLQNVAAASVAITGDGKDAFSVDETSLDGNATLHVSASSANIGTFAATLTISDNADQAEDKVISLSLTVTEPVVEDDVTGTWTLVTDAATLAAGKKVIIAQYVNADGNIQTMAAQSANGNNRTAITSSVAGTTLTPAVGTKVITLADADEGKFYFQASDGYIYNGSSSTKSYLKTKANNTDASWTIEIEDNKASINSVENTNRTKIFYNSSNDLFNCYASGQSDIALYMLEEDTPEPPVVDYTEVRTDLTEGWYYTMCLDKAVTAVKAGSIWRVLSKAANGNDVILEEVTGTLDAGRPYIFRAAASTLEVAYTGDAVLAPVTEGNNGLVGSFTEEPLAQNSNHYIIYNNALYYVNSDNVKVGAHRAYLDMAGVPAYSNEPQQGNAPRRRVTMTVYNEQTTTDIDALNASETPVKMIIDGKLFIIRGEKMYDATGRLVK